MPSILVKGIVGIAGATAVGVTAIYYSTSNNEKKEDQSPNKETTSTKTKVSISSLLTEGKRLLTKDPKDAEKWTQPWTNFKKLYIDKAPETPWNFNEWTTNKDIEAGLNSFKEQCRTLGSTQVEGKDDPIFKEVEANCTTTDPAT